VVEFPAELSSSPKGEESEDEERCRLEQRLGLDGEGGFIERRTGGCRT